MTPRGLFVTLEGVDGAGKSTQARRLAAHLEAAGRNVVLTREPGGSEGAEAIRALLVTGGPGRWSAETELLLFTAARRDHLERIIAPALAAGAVVICDRYVDSTRAYQGLGAADLAEAVEALHRLMIGREADLTLLFDLDPALAAARRSGRDPAVAAADRPGAMPEDRFERRGLAFQQALRARFLELAGAEPAGSACSTPPPIPTRWPLPHWRRWRRSWPKGGQRRAERCAPSGTPDAGVPRTHTRSRCARLTAHRPAPPHGPPDYRENEGAEAGVRGGERWGHVSEPWYQPLA